MQTSKMLVGAIWVLCAQGVYAGQVNNLTTFTPNTPAKAAEVNGNFNAVKSAVDDNDARIKAVEDKVAAALPGMLIGQLKGNLSASQTPGAYVGYLNILSGYTPLVDALAFVQTRCSYDGNAAGQILEHRVAIRAGTVITGGQFYQRSNTPAPNVSVQNVNSDYFELTANVAYDFGVNFNNPTPTGGVNDDFCSAVVMIFRR